MEIVKNNPELLLKVLKDADFVEVLDKLGVVDNKTKLLYIDKLVDLSVKDLEEIEKELENVGYKTDCLPVKLRFQYYIKNLGTVTAKYAVKESQLSKIPGNLATDSEVFTTAFEVVEEYGLPIVDDKGKIEVNLLSLDKETLTTRLDRAIETLEEDEVINNLGLLHIAKVPDIVVGCKSIGSDDYINKKTGKFNYRINNPLKYTENFKGLNLDEIIPSREANNEAVSKVIGTDLNSIEIKELDTDQQILKQSIMMLLPEKNITETKLTYTIDGLKFSKKKFERNLDKFISANLGLTNDQLIFASLTYNSYLNEEDIKKLAETMGFSLAMGGI